MATSLVSISIPPAEIERIRELLNPKQFKQAVFQAVKRTTAAAVSVVVDEVQKQVNLSDKYARRAIFSKMDKGDIPVGEVVISDRRVPLIAYKPRITKAGVSVTFNAFKGNQFFRHAFKAKVSAISSNGESDEHTGIFSRSDHLPTKGPNVGGYRIVKGRRYKLTRTPRGIAGALTFKQLYGPKVISLIQQPAVEAVVKEKLQGRLVKELDSQLSRFTK